MSLNSTWLTKILTGKLTTLGWDVGGAHLKAALVDADGRAITVIQVPCPLWRGLEELHKAMDSVLSRINQTVDQYVVTMTGELADIFHDRDDGVIQIAKEMTDRLGDKVRFYGGSAGMLTGSEITQHLTAIASANWLASATFVATEISHGLFIDVGSTTTDFVLIGNGKPQNRGYSDAERMQSEELTYTGVIRTPLMSFGSHIRFSGKWQALAAEHFATMADVYRLTGDLNDAEDMSDTADNAGKTMEESMRRLARMVCRDSKDAPAATWIELAKAFKELQSDRLEKVAAHALSHSQINDKTPIIGAGVGKFLVRELAKKLNREYLDVGNLIVANTRQTSHWAGICLPAFAVAYYAAVET